MKIHVVTKDNRNKYEAELETSFCHRYNVFVKKFGWNLPNDGVQERDQYDTEDARYLLAINDEGKVRGYQRLTPTILPHIMSDIYPQLCYDNVPRAEDRFEMSRFYCLDGLRHGKKDNLTTAGAVVIGLHEYCLREGINHLSNITHAALLASMISGGYDIKPLGLPLIEDKQCLIGCTVNMTSEALKSVKVRNEFTGSILAN